MPGYAIGVRITVAPNMHETSICSPRESWHDRLNAVFGETIACIEATPVCGDAPNSIALPKKRDAVLAKIDVGNATILLLRVPLPD